MLWRVVVDGIWELDAGVFLADGRPRGRAGRLALASPGCESSFGGLNYVVSYTEFADKTFRSVRGQKVAQHHKVINCSIHGQAIAQIRMKFVVALALLPLSAAIVGGARAASVHVNWAHTKDDLRTRYNSARAPPTIAADRGNRASATTNFILICAIAWP